MGTLLSPIRDEYARMLWQQMYEKDCWLSINFIPGAQNSDADTASRLYNDRTEWCLPVPVFVTIAQKFGFPTIDLFASRLNRKVQRYISWSPDPFCTEVDAFYCSWANEFRCIYPPFNLLNRYTRKIIEDKVEQAIVIFPLWPTQHWFAPLLELAISHTFLLPEEPSIFLPWQEEGFRQKHPQQNSLNLATMLISSNEAILNEFHHTLDITSQQDYDTPLLRVRRQHVKNGLNFARNGKLIPTHLL